MNPNEYEGRVVTEAEYDAMSGDPPFVLRSLPLDGDFFHRFGQILDGIDLKDVAGNPELSSKFGTVCKGIYDICDRLGVTPSLLQDS